MDKTLQPFCALRLLWPPFLTCHWHDLAKGSLRLFAWNAGSLEGSSPAASLRNVKYFQVALSRSEADSWCLDHGETSVPFLGSVVGGSSSHLCCCTPCTFRALLTLLYCAAFIQISLSSSQENTNFYMFGEGTPCLWSHSMTNITASLCLASGFLSLVTIPDLLLKHCYSWDTVYSRTDRL